MKLLILAFSLTCCSSTFAQDAKTVLVKAGKNVTDYLSFADIFLYPSFKNGTVFFYDGSKGSAKLNYNRLMDEINFIDSKGDTLALANDTKETIRAISINSDSFYFDQGYVMHVAGNNVVKLAVREVWTTGEKKKTGVYNSNSLSSATVPLASYFVFNQGHNLVSNDDVEITKVTHYYFGDTHNRFLLAGKKNLLKLFPKDEDRIEKYLKENKVDFNNKQHLEKMVSFIIQS